MPQASALVRGTVPSLHPPLHFTDTGAPISIVLDQGLEPVLNAFELLALRYVVKKYQIINSYVSGMKIHVCYLLQKIFFYCWI